MRKGHQQKALTGDTEDLLLLLKAKGMGNGHQQKGTGKGQRALTADTEQVLLAKLGALRELNETDAGRQVAPCLL